MVLKMFDILSVQLISFLTGDAQDSRQQPPRLNCSGGFSITSWSFFQTPAGLLSFVSFKKSTFIHVEWRRVKVPLTSIKKRDWTKKKEKESFLKCGESISARDCFPSGWIVGYIGFLPKLPPISSKLRIRTTFCFAIAGIWTTVCRFKVVEIALKLLHIRCD